MFRMSSPEEELASNKKRDVAEVGGWGQGRNVGRLEYSTVENRHGYHAASRAQKVSQLSSSALYAEGADCGGVCLLPTLVVKC